MIPGDNVPSGAGDTFPADLERFESERRPRWDELEGLLTRAGRRPERLGGERLRRLGALYRSAAADLVAARRRYPGDPMVDRLEQLVRRGQGLLYERRDRRGNVLDFVVDGYWILLWERRRVLALSAALLAVPFLMAMAWAVTAAETVAGFVPPEFLWVTEAETTDQGMGVVGLAGFSTYVLTNNIRVALTAFVLGISWGIGTALIVGYNGIMLGALSGLAVSSGNARLLGEATLAHGVLELSCIVVAGAAGLSLGRSMLRPANLTRRESLAAEARVALQIAVGTAPWLIVAGLVEGYVSRVGLGLVPTTLVGVLLGGLFWGLLAWRGAIAPGASARSGATFPGSSGEVSRHGGIS